MREASQAWNEQWVLLRNKCGALPRRRYAGGGALISLSSNTGTAATVSYDYDALGRLSTVSANRVTAAAYGYDGVGNLASARFGNNVTNLYQYDARNRLPSLTNLVHRVNTVTLAAFLHLLDPTGLRTNLAEVVNGASVTRAWTYDSLRRLTQESWSGATNGPVTYAFDHVGNRTGRASTLGAVAPQWNSYDANDWRTSDAYDNNGNTTNSAGSAYVYDPLDRLVSVDSGAVNIGYDGDGNRVWRNANGVTTYYLVDDRNPSGYPQVMSEASTDGSSFSYVYGLDPVSQAWTPPGGGIGRTEMVSYFGHDGQGSVRFLTDTNGTVTDTYTYDAYGIQVASTGAGTVNHYLYTGQQRDVDLGMYYLRARYYQPNTGRFWTMDTYEGDNEDPLCLHKYLYCRGNPINAIDPSGHEDLISLSIGSTISASLEAIYNGGVSAAGSAMQASIFGVQANQSANDILTGFILDETGVGLAASAYQAVRGYFQDEQSRDLVAYTLWQEEMIATVFAAEEDNQFENISLQFVPQCFVAGTPVATERGLRPIQDIRSGDKVWTLDENTEELHLRPVLDRFVHRRFEVLEIKAGRDTFKVTGEHPFYVSGKGWVSARDLQSGDQFSTRAGYTIPLDHIDTQKGEFLVYNFEVSIDHDYYVGQEGILTHNANALRLAMGLTNPLLAAHHIVALRAKGAQACRQLLLASGTGIVSLNDIRNGVALPRNLKAKVPLYANSVVHSVLHTRAYYQELERRLQAVAPGKRIQVLNQSAYELLLGTFPH